MKTKTKTAIIIASVAIIVVAAIIVGATIAITGAKTRSPQKLLDLGNHYLLELDYEQALVQFERIIEIDPRNPDGYIGAAKAYIGMGKTNKAIKILEKGNDLIDDDEIKRMLRELKEQKVEEDAIKPMEETTTTESDTAVTPTLVAVPAFEQPPVGIEIGQTAPNFTLELRGGGTVTLWDLRGTPVLLNVCTTWCPPCQQEFPEIQAIHKAYKGKVYVLGVDIGESVYDVDEYFNQFDYDYTIAYDPNGEIDYDYNIEFIPQTWVIDVNGVITDYIAGSTTYDEFSAALDDILG